MMHHYTRPGHWAGSAAMEILAKERSGKVSGTIAVTGPTESSSPQRDSAPQREFTRLFFKTRLEDLPSPRMLKDLGNLTALTEKPRLVIIFFPHSVKELGLVG